MKTIRVRNPEGVDLISSYLLSDPDIEQEDFAAELKYALANNADNIYFLQTWDIENEKLLAFMIAINYPNQKHTFVWQIWRDPKLTNVALVDNYLHRLVLWTENFGKSKIKMETIRDVEAFSRRWNFKATSTVMEFVIPENFEMAIYEEKHSQIVGKDVSDEEKQRRNEESLERPTEGSARGLGSTATTVPGESSGTELAGDGGTVKPADSSGKFSKFKHPRSKVV